MTTVTHTAVGGLIGSLGLGAPMSFLLGAASHLPLDLVPHWDLKRAWIDAAATGGLLAVLWSLFGSSPFFWGAAGAALPDAEHLMRLEKKVFPGHGRAHGGGLHRVHALTQGVVLVASGWAIWRIGS